jgi:hypothetical protein
MTITDAYKLLQGKVQQDAEPALTDAEFMACLTNNARASVWTASTAYSYGDKVVPSVQAGRKYRCIAAGTSGTTEPTWGNTTRGSQVSDYLNSTLLWQDDGPIGAALWDIQGAAYDACGLKASKASDNVDTKDSSQNISNSQFRTNWTREQRKFKRNNLTF